MTSVFAPFFGIELTVVALLLRVAIGTVYLFHGYHKFGADRKHIVETLERLGFPVWLVTFAGVVNFLGGIALILGIFTSVVAALSVLWMIATTWWCKAKLEKNFVSGYDLNITLLLVSLALIALGGGAFSLDNLLRI